MNLLGLAREEMRLSIDGAVRIIYRRWVLGALLLLLAVGVTELAYVAWRNIDAAFDTAYPIVFILGLTLYTDAVRLVLLPDFCLNAVRASRLVGLTVLCIASAMVVTVVILMLLFIILSFTLHLSRGIGLVSSSVFCAALTYCGTRLAFSCYLVGDRGVWAAAARSWRLTKGPTFLVALSVTAVYDLIWFAVWPGIQSLRSAVDMPIALAVQWAVDFALILTLAPVAYIFFARWMLVAERLAVTRDATWAGSATQ